MPLTCASCTATNPDGKHYCGDCGRPLDATILRRIFIIDGLFVALAITILSMAGFAALLGHFGFTKIDMRTVLVFIPMLVGAMLLILLGLLSAGEVSWSRQGFDFSVLGFGTVLSALTLQFFMKTPVLPRFADGVMGQAVTDLTHDARITMFILLSGGIFLSVVCCIIATAVELHLRVARLSREPGTADRVAAFLCYVLGMFSLGIYALIVCGGVEG
jgi:hypothetical protein